MTWKHGLLVVMTTVTLARADLGGTEQELFDRFGMPTVSSDESVIEDGKRRIVGPTHVFERDGWRIECELSDGRCLRINYAKPGDWTPDDIKRVLDSNRQGARWKEITKLSDQPHRLWRRRDGSTAVWSQAAGLQLTWRPPRARPVKD